MAVSAQHVDRLRVRVADTSSKVLVTGDLNAGKSTFVNALLRREVMPVDQQPCTTAFCEVHDFSENGNVEEVHVVKDAAVYKIDDESTYRRASLNDLHRIMDDEENSLGLLKLYLHDSRPLNQSLLNNGVVDISLIDAPGLNRDSLKTTALFSRQEEIDIIVFVVSAENHLTESGQSLLRNASNEKAYLFFVVNKFDQIKNKEKCRSMVLDQIRECSPRTYDDANDLVHFVDSLVGKDDPSFEDLEASLRSFVLGKRAKSKLNPATTYLSNLLSDIELLVGSNAIVAQEEIVRAKGDLNAALPVLERMKSSRQVLEDALEAVEEQSARSASGETKRMLTHALDRIAEGRPGGDSSSIQMPSYPGILNIWDYARDVRSALLAGLDMAVKDAENEARDIATAGVKQVFAIGEDHLPAGVERSHRVFMPEAMFSTHRMRNGKRKIRQDSIVVAGGTLGLGIGLAARPELIQPTFFDLLDVPHHFRVYFGDGKEISEDESGPSALSIMSVGIGVVTTIGIRAFVESAVRITDVLSHESTRNWAGPVFGAIVMGATAYLVLDLPNSVPRTVGRRIRNSVTKPESSRLGIQEEPQFIDAQAGRIARETRKVLRLAAWDLKERFRVAFEERSRGVMGAEEMERRAVRAKEWFATVGQRTADIREQAGLVVTLS
jgi:mitofusin